MVGRRWFGVVGLVSISCSAAPPEITPAPARARCAEQREDWPATFTGFYRIPDRALYDDSGILRVERSGIVLFTFQSGGAWRRALRWTKVDDCTWRGVDPDGVASALTLDAAAETITEEDGSGRTTLHRVEPAIEAECAARFRAVSSDVQPFKTRRP